MDVRGERSRLRWALAAAQSDTSIPAALMTEDVGSPRDIGLHPGKCDMLYPFPAPNPGPVAGVQPTPTSPLAGGCYDHHPGQPG